MTYPGNVSQDLERVRLTVSALSSDVDALQERCDDLDRQSSDHDDRLTDIDRTLSDLHEEHEQFSDGVDERLVDLRAGLDGLASAVAWLERRVRAEQHIEPVDLDTVDEQIQRLAVHSQQGQQSAAVLLTVAQRRRHEQNITEFQELVERIERATAEALQQSALIATTEYGTTEHDQAGAAYRSIVRGRQNDMTRRSAAEALATGSRAALERDDSNRKIHSPQVATGESARAILRTRLRERIADAVASGALMPAWFTTVLGHQPPAERTEQWLTTATSILLYRITYTVTDPALALGTRPEVADTDRRAWYTELEQDLTRIRRWPS